MGTGPSCEQMAHGKNTTARRVSRWPTRVGHPLARRSLLLRLRRTTSLLTRLLPLSLARRPAAQRLSRTSATAFKECDGDIEKAMEWFWKLAIELEPHCATLLTLTSV